VLVVGGSGRVGGSTVSWLETFSGRRRRRAGDSSRRRNVVDSTESNVKKSNGNNGNDDGNDDDDDDDLYSFMKDMSLNIIVGGRRESSFDRALNGQKLFSSNVEFLELDVEQDSDVDLSYKLQGMDLDLVVHTAGPFQGRRDPKLLRVCIQSKIPYVDVCDEYELAQKAKQHDLFEVAVQNNVPAIVCGGIWPGISSLMAMDAVDKLLLLEEEEQQQQQQQKDLDDDDTAGAAAAASEEVDDVDSSSSSSSVDVDVNVNVDVDVDVEYSFFTAGTGNAGPTIVSATFLLLATPVLTYLNSKPLKVEPWTSPRTIDFGGKLSQVVVGGNGNGNNGLSQKPVWLLDNPDVPTTATALLSSSFRKSSYPNNNNNNVNINNVNVSSRFGTDPLVWNYLFGMIKTVVPVELLKNQKLMQNFALFSEPIIRLVDKFVGATNAMRVDVTITTTKTTKTTKQTTDQNNNDDNNNDENNNNKKKKKTSLIVHPDLERCVGLATAAFAVEVLKSSLQQQQQSQSSSSSSSSNSSSSNNNSVDTTSTTTTTTDIIPSGVWYPAELPTGVRRNLLKAAKEEAITYDV